MEVVFLRCGGDVGCYNAVLYLFLTVSIEMWSYVGPNLLGSVPVVRCNTARIQVCRLSSA